MAAIRGASLSASSTLDSAAFFDYFGSSIRLDADEDNSSGATEFDFNNSFDASLGTPVPAGIVDSDVRISNYDEANTSVTKVYVQISNPSGSDEISIDTAGLSNISVASDTGTYIELDWTGTTSFIKVWRNGQCGPLSRRIQNSV